MKMPVEVELYPTRLTMPQWSGTPQVKVLPGRPKHYFIDEVLPDWFVVTDLDGDRVYSGLGPVSVERSPTCFS